MALEVDAYRAVIARAGTELIASAEAVRDDAAAVPTCPRWTVRQLVAHQAMVHAWAVKIIGGGDPAEPPETAGVADPQLYARYRAGLHELLGVLRGAPDDLDVPRFLADPPPARVFWARRQAHETAIHAVDARATLLRRVPTSGEVHFTPAFCVDGVDELLRGFLPRETARLRSEEPFTILIAADGTDAAWTVRVSADPPVTTVGAAADPDAIITAAPLALYLGLWNRGDELTATGRDGVLAQWREQQRIGW